MKPVALARRIVRMSPHEIQTRLRQAGSSRADELRYRLGLPAKQPALTVSGAPGKFFFESADAPL
jgi:hypothetical protein